MATDSDGDFVRQALERYREPLLRFAASLVGPSQAPDVVQDTFLALCKAERVVVPEHVAPWLFRVCRNRALDVLRQQERLQPIGEDENMPSPDSGPSSSIERKQSVSRMENILEALPAKQRQALLLKFSGGLSYKEIAEVMELSVTNVGFILHKAIKKVRQQLARDEQRPSVRSAP